MLNEVKESNSSEVTKLRGDWDALTSKIHHLEAEVDASQALVRDVCAERDGLRSVLENKQAEIHAEDQDLIKEMQALLAEFAALSNAENSDALEKSGVELLKRFAEVTEKSVEKLTKRAEVSTHVSCFELHVEAMPVKDLAAVRPLQPIAASAS